MTRQSTARRLCFDPDPDFNRLLKVLRREGEPDRLPLYEIFSDIEFEVLRLLGRPADPEPGLTREQERDWRFRKHVEYAHLLGYDYVDVFVEGLDFNARSTWRKGTTNEGERLYLTAASRAITSREDFGKHPWPDPASIDYCGILDWMGERLPAGMKALVGCNGVLENTVFLLGVEGISYLLYDDEPLVRDTFDAVGRRKLEYIRRCIGHDAVGLLNFGDDIGFRTQTLLSPAMLREYVFPWYKKIVDVVHAAGKPAVLHSCGNRSQIMEDIIACGWDAVHSFEDSIEPVWEAKQKWGDRITVLGGFDMDKISRMSEQEVRRHTRFLIEECAPGGGWALGTGNSVANYIPPENLLAMIEEGIGATR